MCRKILYVDPSVITVMLYLDFQRGIVPHNLHVCAAFFKTAGIPQYRTLDPSLHIDGHRDFILYKRMYLFLTYIHKKNNATVIYFLNFMSIFLKFIYSLLL